MLAGFAAQDDKEDELTAASNAAVDLVHAGKLDEAEQAARDLLERFPDVHDGWDRLGMVYEARGDHKQAADCYRKVIDFIREHPDSTNRTSRPSSTSSSTGSINQPNLIRSAFLVIQGEGVPSFHFTSRAQSDRETDSNNKPRLTTTPRCRVRPRPHVQGMKPQRRRKRSMPKRWQR